jgi:hypothetical protein
MHDLVNEARFNQRNLVEERKRSLDYGCSLIDLAPFYLEIGFLDVNVVK